MIMGEDNLSDYEIKFYQELGVHQSNMFMIPVL